MRDVIVVINVAAIGLAIASLLMLCYRAPVPPARPDVVPRLDTRAARDHFNRCMHLLATKQRHHYSEECADLDT